MGQKSIHQKRYSLNLLTSSHIKIADELAHLPNKKLTSQIA
ncbi:hypothetical protein HMPREF0539_2088 [Lacticaseibacillus rhamnosus LMS2-1]|uniref:Uncharacterized protein n=1 Tax=Lacticaseibacillus rhamnosus (strain LMS2-1) TaxID=525361 RepID=C2JYV3_LACRM|nr:hypothetical protein HMPREF0539_2088 [Lacticaseibacillus rhamnosus LMS2-1]